MHEPRGEAQWGLRDMANHEVRLEPQGMLKDLQRDAAPAISLLRIYSPILLPPNRGALFILYPFASIKA